MTIYPDYAEGHRALGDVLAYAGQPDEAIVHLRRAIALDPGDPRPHVSLARVLAAKGLNTEAEAEMQKSRELHR